MKFSVFDLWRNRDVRNRLLVTLAIILIFKIGTYIPLYGIDVGTIGALKLNPAFETLNGFSGGALSRYSILALGLSPYITASIVMQILQQGISPKFKELASQGDMGRRVLKRWTFFISAILGFLQAMGLVFGLYRLADLNVVQNPSVVVYAIMIAILAVSSFVLALLAEVITKKGIGQGSSIIVAVGILTELPINLYQYLVNKKPIVWVLTILAVLMLMLVCYYFDRMTIKYQTHHSKTLGSVDVKSYLPIKVNIAGVVPTIFASAVLVIPSLLISLFKLNDNVRDALLSIVSVQTFAGIIFYTSLVMIFTLIYAHIQIDTQKMAEGLSRQNIYLDGLQPGVKTANYLSKQVNKLSVASALFLIAIITTPLLVGLFLKLPTNISMMGTSVLILVGVGFETYRQIRGKLFVDKYTHVWQG